MYYETILEYIKEFQKDPLQTSLITAGGIVLFVILVFILKRFEDGK